MAAAHSEGISHGEADDENGPARRDRRAEGTRRRSGRRRTDARPGALENEIRLRAYYRYLEREEDSGDATTDWLEAESDVLGRRATGVDAEEKVLDNGR